MCSVVGCESWRRSAQRFKLPEDPERRLEWVQFLFDINGQRLKESSWTDITICTEHFTNDCFEDVTPAAGTVQLKSRAVPSLCIKSEPDEPEPDQKSVKTEVTEDTSQCDHLSIYDSPSSDSEESEITSYAAQESPVPSDTSDTSMYDYGQMLQKIENIDIIREKVALLQIKRKYVVNESRLIPLFARKCPLCGSKVKVEKVTYRVLIILNKQCIQCEYRDQWKSQVKARVPTDDQHMTGVDVTPETQQTESTDEENITIKGVFEYIAFDDEEEGDPMDEREESGDEGDTDSDDDWSPSGEVLLNDESDEGSENKDYDDLPKHSQLCTECGKFFSEQKPHTCEHKIKPYSCNICGKRCVNEAALNCHSRVHGENYEHQCKYCNVAFKTKVDKRKHEQTHITEGKPYKCPECSETFSTNKGRRIHLRGHGGPQQLKCDYCGIQFYSLNSLQRHLPVHTGVKLFKCSVCERGFSQAGHLKSHMRLHTGEKPYKCEHCDKCFNHNVSLKSHVQRYHTSNAGCGQKEKKHKTVIDTVDALENRNKKGTDSGPDNEEEEEHEKEEEVQKERTQKPKSKRRSTGRPIGRPKKNAVGNLARAGQVESQCSKSKTAKVKARRLKRTRCSDEESEGQPTESDISFDSAEEEEQRNDKVALRKGRSKGRGKNSNSDSDFDPDGLKKKSYSNQNSGNGSGKRRGRPKKNQVVNDI